MSNIIRTEMASSGRWRQYNLLDILTFAGAAVTANMTCNSGHEEKWTSSSNVGEGSRSMPYVNVLLIVYTFMAGLHFDRLKVLIVLD